ncbi:hypothetical protein Esti_003415 [Eimeria stiedai]
MWRVSRLGLRGLDVSEAAAAARAAAARAATAAVAASSAGKVKLLPARRVKDLTTPKWAVTTTGGIPTLRTLHEQQRQVPSLRSVLLSKALLTMTRVASPLLGQSQEGPPRDPEASTPRGQASAAAAQRQLGSASFPGVSRARWGPLYWSISRRFSCGTSKRTEAPRYWEASFKPRFPSSSPTFSRQQPLQREQQWRQHAQVDKTAARSNGGKGPPLWPWVLVAGMSGAAGVCWLSERRRRIEEEAAAAAQAAAAAAAAERSVLGWFLRDWGSLGGSPSGSSDTRSRQSEVSPPSGFPAHVWWAWESPRSPEAMDLIAFSSGFLPLQAHEAAWGSRRRHEKGRTDINPWRSSAAAAQTLLGLNALIFVAWRVAALSNKSPWGARLLQLLMLNFLASREAMRALRLHTLLTASMSHAAFLHILMNGMLLQLLLQQLQPVLSGPEVWALWALSSLMGVAAHMSVSTLPVLGASSFACCLLWVEGVCRSRDLFMTVLPVPGVMLTALQLSQLNVAVNGGLYLLSRFGKGPVARALQGVSWVGHLGGIAAGCLFSAYKRHVAHDNNWGSFTNLSRNFSAADWRNTRADLADSLEILGLWIRMHLGEQANLSVLQMKLEQLRTQRRMRRAFET